MALLLPDSRQPLLVYRDRIGVRSELAFSRRQYLGFTRFRPVWIGRHVLADANGMGADGMGGERMELGAIEGLLSRHFGIAPVRDWSGFAPVVHAQFARGGALALPLARAMDARLVVTLHGGDVGKDANWRHSLLARRWPAVIARTHRFVCVSHAVAETALRRAVPERLITVLPIGVEVPAAIQAGARSGGLLFTGRFVEKKGLVVLADAMRRLRAQGGMAPLVCAGDGPLRPLLEALARDIVGVSLVGWLNQTEIAAAMDAARVLLVPSVVAANGDAEGLPSVVPEAMARGCAVIGTDQGGIAEAISDGATGLLVPAGDAAALAGAIARMIGEPGLAARLAEGGFAFARTHLNAVTQSAALERIIADAAR